jgi:hypothetical protein
LKKGNLNIFFLSKHHIMRILKILPIGVPPITRRYRMEEDGKRLG